MSQTKVLLHRRDATHAAPRHNRPLLRYIRALRGCTQTPNTAALTPNVTLSCTNHGFCGTHPPSRGLLFHGLWNSQCGSYVNSSEEDEHVSVSKDLLRLRLRLATVEVWPAFAEDSWRQPEIWLTPERHGINEVGRLKKERSRAAGCSRYPHVLLGCIVTSKWKRQQRPWSCKKEAVFYLRKHGTVGEEMGVDQQGKQGIKEEKWNEGGQKYGEGRGPDLWLCWNGLCLVL